MGAHCHLAPKSPALCTLIDFLPIEHHPRTACRKILYTFFGRRLLLFLKNAPQLDILSLILWMKNKSSEGFKKDHQKLINLDLLQPPKPPSYTIICLYDMI